MPATALTFNLAVVRWMIQSHKHSPLAGLTPKASHIKANQLHFRIFHVFVSTFSAFSAFSLRGLSSDPCLFWDERDLPHFPRVGFALLISMVQPTGFIENFLREAKPGGFQSRVFPTFFGKRPDCVADPFGTVPRRCS